MVRRVAQGIFAVALAVWLAGCATLDTPRVIERAQSSIVRITGTVSEAEERLAWITDAGYVCSGFVIGPNTVLTAAHCIGSDIYADGVPVKVIRVDKTTDLALVEVKTDRAPLLFRGDSLCTGELTRFEELNAIGYAWGWTKLTVLKVRAFLLDVSPYDGAAPGILTQGGFIGGMSGGPVVDVSGCVVGMVQQSNGSVGYGVGLPIISAFLRSSDAWR